MTEEAKRIERLSEVVMAFWPVIVGFLVAAAAWGALTMEVTWLRQGQDQVIRGNQQIISRLDALSANVASMQTATTYTSSEVADLRNRVRALEGRRSP